MLASGQRSASVVRDSWQNRPQILERLTPDVCDRIAGAFEGWTDENIATALGVLFEKLATQGNVDTDQYPTWLGEHQNDPDSVEKCLNVIPPQDVKIEKVLSQKGSQKRVYKATRGSQEVVLKQLIGTPVQNATIVGRESQAHPLSMEHPNIIETFPDQNSDGEYFLIEEFLGEVLDDDWRPSGSIEAANFIFDISSALAYLHDVLGKVHGDIKPDNIGRRGDIFILLDFGIARPKDQIVEATATGSLRTRAPELLVDDTYEYPDRADVWALGAVLFHSFEDRFPLFDEGQPVIRQSKPDERATLEATLKERAKERYDEFVHLEKTPVSFRSLLDRALAKNPEKRITAAGLKRFVATKMPSLLRTTVDDAHVTPPEEVRQYLRILRVDEASMPHEMRAKLLVKLRKLRNFPGLDAERGAINQLISKLDN